MNSTNIERYKHIADLNEEAQYMLVGKHEPLIENNKLLLSLREDTKNKDEWLGLIQTLKVAINNSSRKTNEHIGNEIGQIKNRMEKMEE